MWHIDKRDTGQAGLPGDIRRAVDRLQLKLKACDTQLHPFFDGHRSIIAARAPGRLDVMGGVADYSGSTVLQLPLSESAVILCQASVTPEIRIVSCGADENSAQMAFGCSLESLISSADRDSISLQRANLFFSSLPLDQQWAAYIAGTLIVLMREFEFDLEHGIIVYLDSTVPAGKGVSSSAAIEVASMCAFARLLNLTISKHRQALLCQRVENQIVGAPCGLMDQMTSSAGENGQLLRLLCQPDTLQAPVGLPQELVVLGIDSGVKHSVSGAAYSSVRTAAFMGYRLLLDYAGIATAEIKAEKIADQLWHGYLANISVSEYCQRFAGVLPETLAGEEFLSRFDATTDDVTEIDPGRHYAIRRCTEHPIYEHFRVRLFIRLLQALVRGDWCCETAELLGECMYQSHASYSLCGLGSEETDAIVALLRSAGPAKGVYGARISGGGSGGTVSVLLHKKANPLVIQIATEFGKNSASGGRVFQGSSSGAAAYALPPKTP